MENEALETSIEVDNSSDDVQYQEPSNEDNSNEQYQEPANQDTDNANNNDVNGEAEEGQSNTATSQFKSYEEAVKGYNELQKKLGQQSNELGELRKKAELADRLQKEKLEIVQNYGFNSLEDFKAHQEQQQYNTALARFEADEYSKFIDKCDNPQEMQRLLMLYRENPSAETLEYIESDFPLDVIKHVNSQKTLYEGQLQQQQAEAQQKQVYNSAKEYLEINVNKHAEEFKNPAFAKLYEEAFKAYGCDLNTDYLVGIMQEFKNHVINEYKIKNGIKNDNISATDEISELSANSSNTARSEKDILSMSEAEMLKELRKYK